MRLLYDQTEASGRLRERLSKLGYSVQQINRFSFLTTRSGLTLLSGPTGHGKSTALKHIMECMASENPEKAYMSIEDPPEYPLENVYQSQVNSGYDLSTGERGERYRDAIAGAMRSDPDTLMVGEIRYPDAAVAALDAAQTGHGVWSTIMQTLHGASFNAWSPCFVRPVFLILWNTFAITPCSPDWCTSVWCRCCVTNAKFRL